MTRDFGAPWGLRLKLVNAFSLALLLGSPGLLLVAGPEEARVFSAIALAFGAALVLVVWIFHSVRGYTVTPEWIVVRRPGPDVELRRSELVSAVADPAGMKGTRSMTNGGLFSFGGSCWSRKLGGAYRAYATDARLAVVLRFSNQVVVLTPDDPEGFVASVERRNKAREDR